ncbi:MAG TPA: MATE family efflux transporter, partial [Candidatus Ruminococcus gallistercoris]|nr:MATE family efflux transporter [Candidatus Ruminococcus gallistercoris]
MNSNALFAKTPPLKLFFIASIPGAVSMLASALYQTLDGVFVGQFLGATAFAALNLAMPFVIINFSLADLIGVGSAVPISICLGRKDEQEANNIFTCACLMIVGAGVVIGGILFAAAPLLIRLMGAEGQFADFAVQYLRVYAICSPITTIIFAVDNFLRICGFIRGSMLLNIFMSVISAILEFLFLGVFRWGIWAAALATCSGMLVCVLL